jgi:UDP-N-acetylglucosamine 2-epimerase (non-hydrolysing)
MTFLVCFGTRPEIIKIYPIIVELKRIKYPFKTLFSGQHADLINQFKNLIGEPDFILNTLERGQSLNLLSSKILYSIDEILKNNTFKCIIVQGDTTTAFNIAYAAFNFKLKIAHIEAGLRTFDKYSPFPEEINRTLISHIADFHFVPTLLSKSNLETENIFNNIFIVGNTIIDAIVSYNFSISYNNLVLITLHRRENFHNLTKLFSEINSLAEEYNALHFMFLKHHSIKDSLYSQYIKSPNITLCSPLDYNGLLQILSQCLFVISDSGGIQEECTYFKKKILICRDSTERPEVIDSGFGLLVGTDILKNKDWIFKNPIINNKCPFGDGNSSKKICSILNDFFK